VELPSNRSATQEVFVSHRNAALTPRARLRLARLIVDQEWPVARAAERYDVSWRTADRWARRYRELGEAGMVDRSSRPHHSPNRTPAPVVRKLVHLRLKQRLGPVAIGAKLSMPSSTVQAVLVRCRLNRLSHIDRVTGEPVRRYEHDHPGSLLHVDVKKLGNVPHGGGWHYVGRRHGRRNRSATPGHRVNVHYNAIAWTQRDRRQSLRAHRARRPLPVAYAEVHDDETAATATAVLRDAVAWFGARGVTLERVLSDNGSAYKSHLWRDTCAELGIIPKKTRPYRPQTNGKIERFHRTLADGWAFKRFYSSEGARRAALPAWIHEYNHHRTHTAIGKATPITRLTNLPGQYT
jgi:transposase InsO family protein